MYSSLLKHNLAFKIINRKMKIFNLQRNDIRLISKFTNERIHNSLRTTGQLFYGRYDQNNITFNIGKKYSYYCILFKKKLFIK